MSPKAQFLSSPPAVAPDGTIYVSMEKQICSITSQGVFKWSTSLEYVETPVISVDASGTLYTAGSLGIEHMSSFGSPFYQYTGNLSTIDTTGSLTSLWTSTRETDQPCQFTSPVLLDQQKVLMLGDFISDQIWSTTPEDMIFLGIPTNHR